MAPSEYKALTLYERDAIIQLVNEREEAREKAETQAATGRRTVDLNEIYGLDAEDD